MSINKPDDLSNDQINDLVENGRLPMTPMGKVKTAAPSRDGVAVKGKTKGKMITMKKGGRAC